MKRVAKWMLLTRVPLMNVRVGSRNVTLLTLREMLPLMLYEKSPMVSFQPSSSSTPLLRTEPEFI